MEVQMFWYYLLVKLDDFLCSSAVIMILTGLILGIVGLMTAIETADGSSYYEKDLKVMKKILKFVAPVFIISLMFTTFVPSTKQAAFIWIAPQIVENGAVKDTVKNIPELTKLGTEYLKELLKEKVNDK